MSLGEGEENIKRVLKDFGLTETEAKVYLFLAKHDALKGTQIAKQIKKDKAQVYRILKSLQAKGLVESTLEVPVRFVPVPFEKVVESTIKAKHEEAERIENARKDLIENWKSITKHVPEILQEKLVIIEGRHKIYSKMLDMVNETKNQFSASILPALPRADQFGIIDAAVHHPTKYKVQFRFLADLNEQNLNLDEVLIKRIPSRGVNLKLSTPDLDLKPCPMMVIRDEEEAIFFMKSEADPLNPEHNNTCLWTNSKSLVLAFLAIFDERWSKATDIQNKIEEIKTGKATQKTSITGQILKTKEMLDNVWINAQPSSTIQLESYISFPNSRDITPLGNAPPKSGVLNEPVLVGREHELKELQSYLNSATQGKGKTVFVSGEAGSGKTRLVSEFLKIAREQNVTILTGWCLSNASVPYFPFFEVFNSARMAVETV